MVERSEIVMSPSSLEKPQTPRKRRLVDGKYFGQRADGDRLVLRNAH